MPRLHMLSEGDSMSRRFTSRLAPSHADPPDQQIAHFPELASLTPEEISAVRDKFRFYEESTDASFRRWFWSIASASSNARYEGMPFVRVVASLSTLKAPLGTAFRYPPQECVQVTRQMKWLA